MIHYAEVCVASLLGNKPTPQARRGKGDFVPKKYQYYLPKHRVDHGIPVRVGDLRTDDKAQRTLNQQRAKSIADNMVREAIGTIIVSQRANGDMYIVDGMHRWYACQLKDIKELIAEVHHGLNQQEEAILFLIKNRESNKPRALDEYNIGLTAKLPLFVDTENALANCKLSMGSTGPNTIGAVSGVLRITDLYGHTTLERTLKVAERAWGRTKETWDGMLLGGIGMFIGKHGDNEKMNDKDLADRIGKEVAHKWRANVTSLASMGGVQHSGTGSRVNTCYRLVLQAWNKGRRKNHLFEA